MDKKRASWSLVIFYFLFGRLVILFVHFLDINWECTVMICLLFCMEFHTIKLTDGVVRGLEGKERRNRWKWKKQLENTVSFMCLWLCILIWQEFHICLLAKLAMAAKLFEVVCITGFFFAWHTFSQSSMIKFSIQIFFYLSLYFFVLLVFCILKLYC